MRAPISLRDRLIWRLIWGAAISFSVTTSGAFLPRPVAAYSCCRYDRTKIVFPSAPPAEEYVVPLASIDPYYVLNRVLIPIIYASLIIRIIWLIQRK